MRVTPDEHTHSPEGWSGADAPAQFSLDTPDGEPLEFDPYDFDWIVGEVKRRPGFDEVVAYYENGIPAFLAKRERKAMRRLMVLGAFGVVFTAAMFVFGGISNLFGSSGSTGASVWIFALGLFVSAVVAWLLAVRIMPQRPILVHLHLDPDEPDIAIAPTSRYRWGRAVLSVVERERGLVGYLVQEDNTKFSWSATYPNRLLNFRIAKRPGTSGGMVFLAFLFPPVGWALLLHKLSVRSGGPLAVLSGTGKLRYGSINPVRGLGGEIVIDVGDDPERYAERVMVMAAALALVMHG